MWVRLAAGRTVCLPAARCVWPSHTRTSRWQSLPHPEVYHLSVDDKTSGGLWDIGTLTPPDLVASWFSSRGYSAIFSNVLLSPCLKLTWVQQLWGPPEKVNFERSFHDGPPKGHLGLALDLRRCLREHHTTFEITLEHDSESWQVQEAAGRFRSKLRVKYHYMIIII